MTTLNARAHQAWHEAEAESEFGFEGDDEAFEAGWEKGFQSATSDMLGLLRILRAGAITSERKNAYDVAIRTVEELQP
jgi:hypothetical protein